MSRRESELEVISGVDVGPIRAVEESESERRDFVGLEIEAGYYGGVNEAMRRATVN